MQKDPLHRSNFLLLLLIGLVAGFPSDFLRRQLTGESLTDGLTDWFWTGITGLDAVAGAINGWVNDLVLPNAPTDGKNWQDDRAPDIQLETIVAPVKDFGDGCKPAAPPGEQGTMVG